MNSFVNIVYEDNHLFVLNKPSGLPTQPTDRQVDNLQDAAKQWLKETLQKPGQVFLEPIHRLDKPVSGIVVFAKTSKALSRLNAAMREKQYKKRYMALCEGHFSCSEATLEHFLIHDHHQARIVDSTHLEGKKSVLHYRVCKTENAISHLDIDIETGRYHQIRIQLSAAGHPILGDFKYGSRIPYREGAIALHHYSLELPHPITREIMTFKADIPF